MGDGDTFSPIIRAIIGVAVGVIALCVSVGHSAVQIEPIAPAIVPAAEDDSISVSVFVPPEVAFGVAAEKTGRTARSSGTDRLYLPADAPAPAASSAPPGPAAEDGPISISLAAPTEDRFERAEAKANSEQRDGMNILLLPPAPPKPPIPGAPESNSDTPNGGGGDVQSGGNAPDSAGQSASGQGDSSASSGGGTGSGQNSGGLADAAGAVGNAVGGAVGAVGHAAGGLAGGTGGLLK